jgi:hypothetical protein
LWLETDARSKLNLSRHGHRAWDTKIRIRKVTLDGVEAVLSAEEIGSYHFSL